MNKFQAGQYVRQNHYKSFQPNLINRAWELDNMLDIGHTIVLGALLREESRGAHSRRDFPERRDAEWMKHTVATLGKDGKPNISYKDVTFTQYEPMERKY